MAALSDAPLAQLVDLRDVGVEELNPVLEQETQAWQQHLEWDFTPSGDLVRRFIHMQALSGCALAVRGAPVGYCYYVCEDHKGLIGDLFILEEFATADNETRLLAAVLQSLIETPYVRRIESQLMLLHSTPGRTLPYARYLKNYLRDFMVIDLACVHELAVGRAAPTVVLTSWGERHQEEAAHLIAGAYHGHIDSDINDQYRSVAGARRFLQNIVQYPGCGSFFQPASWLAFHPDTGGLCGLSLASLVATDIGHITQICVSPGIKGAGIGYELMRRSLLSLAQHGCRKVSLTVTTANHDAVRLYERMGFETKRRFFAYVWEGF